MTWPGIKLNLSDTINQGILCLYWVMLDPVNFDLFYKS